MGGRGQRRDDRACRQRAPRGRVSDRVTGCGRDGAPPRFRGDEGMIRLIATFALVALQPAPPTNALPSIVFVCEHGAAKSVIATAYFNKLASDRGLPYRATFRGTSPQEELSVRAAAGLKADGIPVPAGRPSGITDGDVSSA